MFTAPMRIFLASASGRGLLEWIASHGELKALAYAENEPMGEVTTYRYRARIGEAPLWLSVSITRRGEIAQIYWW